MGVISPLGLSVPTFWRSLVAGRSGISHIERWDASEHTTRIGGEIKDFDPTLHFEKRTLKKLDPFSQYAVVAAGEALEASGLDLDRERRDRIGVILGSSFGGIYEFETQHAVFLERGPRRVSPHYLPRVLANSAAGNVAIRYGLHGPNFVTGSACASANHAMGCALKLVQAGMAEVIVTGGSDASLTQACTAAFCACRALSKRNDEPERASRPFDKDRDGFVMAEGAGILVFECLEHALARKAHIHCEVLGVGMSDDGFHLTLPDPEATHAQAAMRQALEDARIDIERVDYVNAHGTSTRPNDAMETKAIKGLFGQHAHSLMVSSTKSMVGHLLGASGGVEAIATARTLETGVVHPTINQETPDPECDLEHVPNTAREADVQIALSNSFGFGGHNAILVLGRFAG